MAAVIPSVCLKHRPLGELRPGARITHAPQTYLHAEQTRMRVIDMLPEAYQVAVHTSCLCNEYLSLTTRHIRNVIPGYTAKDWEEHDEYISEVCNNFNLPVLQGYERMPKVDVVNSYTGAKKRTYVQALGRIKEGVNLPRASKVSMFLKPDKFPRLLLEGSDPKPPRSIQFRTPEFNLLLASYLKPYEHGMYESLKSPIGLRCVAKGMNNVQRAENLVEASKSFRRPVYFGADHSKFDSSIRKVHLKWLHRQYKRSIKHRALKTLLKLMIKNRCKSKNGIKYVVEGTRMSGDFDTALGNTLINFLVLTTALGDIKHHLLIDGDDSVLIVEQDDADGLLEHIIYHCHRMGFQTKIDKFDTLHEVEFCQSKLLPSDPPRFSRNPRRALSNYTLTIKDYQGDARLRYLAGVGKGELAASAGVPIMQAYALSRAKASDKPMDIEELRVAYGVVDKPIEICHQTRVYFEAQWGITIDQQLRVESMLTTPTRVSNAELLKYYCDLPYE